MFLSVCNWDVEKATAVIARRKLLQSPTDHSSAQQYPLVVPAQGTSDPAAGTAQPHSSCGAVGVQSLPKSADMSKSPDGEMPSTDDVEDIYFYLPLSFYLNLISTK